MNSQKLSIRLLKTGVTPGDAVRDGGAVASWDKIPGAKIYLGTLGGSSPKWARFLELTDEERQELTNRSAAGLVFVYASDRWFALSFGLGHVKLDPFCVEQDFGLRVVLNTVDPKQLRSADLRTPDENTLTRRSQTSRCSDQTAFSIDIEKDIIRGIAGHPLDEQFGSRVAGSDALVIDLKAVVGHLPDICARVFAAYERDDYKENFAWVDQIRHVRDQGIIDSLDETVVAAINDSLGGNVPSTLHLAFPAIYEPMNTNFIRYKGFNSSSYFVELDLAGYLEALEEKGKTEISVTDLVGHTVHEVDDSGRDNGEKWRLRDCVVFETTLDGIQYVLSGGRWYKVDPNLATEVSNFFAGVARVELPAAEEGENEEKYNQRIAVSNHGLLCLDRKLVKPTGANYAIEVCDFLSADGSLIHIKDQTSSSRLSHLFNQGTVSARVLKVDGLFRNHVHGEIAAQEAEFGLNGFGAVIPAGNVELNPADFTVVYAVLVSSDQPQLPFFSLVTFRQAARELQALGFKFAFSWIAKPKASAAGKAKRKPKATVPE